MRKRDLLRLGAALPVLSFFPQRLLAKSVASQRAMRRVRPSDQGWPNVTSWEMLRDAVGGNLYEVKPLFGACAQEPQGAACAEAMKYLGNPFWIGDQAGGTEVSAQCLDPCPQCVRTRRAQRERCRGRRQFRA